MPKPWFDLAVIRKMTTPSPQTPAAEKALRRSGVGAVVLDMITPSVSRPLRRPAATRSLSRRRMERSKMAGQMATRVGRERQRAGIGGPRLQVETATFILNIWPERVRVSSQELWSAKWQMAKGLRQGILEIQSSACSVRVASSATTAGYW
jgi:hypothetical protein